MRMKYLFLIMFFSCMSVLSSYADDSPTISPTATFINSNGEEEESTEYSGSAPLVARFYANTENAEGWSAYYEWRFSKAEESEPYLIRYEENTEYTFSEAGAHKIVVYAVFTQDNDTVSYTEEYWNDADPIRVTISESKLEMPNAFSPNGDDYNEIYRAKETYQSLVEFHAAIYNRWGQKLYEWDDPAGGWDGTFHGSPVKEGVYFVHVRAKGADGRTYNIRKDVNLLRGYRENESGSSSTSDQ
mgnify:CR=1 FL=1